MNIPCHSCAIEISVCSSWAKLPIALIEESKIFSFCTSVDDRTYYVKTCRQCAGAASSTLSTGLFCDRLPFLFFLFLHKKLWVLPTILEILVMGAYKLCCHGQIRKWITVCFGHYIFVRLVNSHHLFAHWQIMSSDFYKALLSPYLFCFVLKRN